MPSSAVTFDQDSISVQVVVNGNKIEQRIVTVGLTAGDFIEVKDGLKEGDVVVTRAGTFLRDGDIVRPVVPEAALSEAK